MEFKEFKNETGKILKEYWITPAEWDALDKTTVQEGDIYHIVGTIGEEDLSASLINKLSDKASKTYIHKVNILASNGGVPPMEIQVYSKSATLFTQISDIPNGCYTMTNADDGYFGLLAFYNGAVSRIWNSGETLNCRANITPSETSYIFSGDTVVEL